MAPFTKNSIPKQPTRKAADIITILICLPYASNHSNSFSVPLLPKYTLKNNLFTEKPMDRNFPAYFSKTGQDKDTMNVKCLLMSVTRLGDGQWQRPWPTL